ncbi:MAG: hypothetical protein AVDCRST_MAG69-979 [uncultured Solirubrobacteraceae bacterium]|uniref:Circularly permuted ATP-grasp type 2 domain-containing protein n=1 Tax=uncultured Solirubrobacteraceae bacterium TaxID=1162706 RepID=A0A6J4S3L9_9ACTN|nr:MAG: hypothetical protein AVDCRST_MAG69-979 [uncultured Solirubrobacteraceae bacterium]
MTTAPAGPALGIVGFDVVRRPDGTLAVLEDNLLTPGHVALPALRDVNPLRAAAAVADVAAATVELLGALLGGGAEAAAILSDEPGERASWELQELGSMLRIPVLGYEDLQVRGSRLCTCSGRRIDVLWQRTSEDRLRDDAGDLTALGRLLLEPRRGRAAPARGGSGPARAPRPRRRASSAFARCPPGPPCDRRRRGRGPVRRRRWRPAARRTPAGRARTTDTTRPWRSAPRRRAATPGRRGRRRRTPRAPARAGAARRPAPPTRGRRSGGAPCRTGRRARRHPPRASCRRRRLPPPCRLGGRRGRGRATRRGSPRRTTAAGRSG